MPTTEELEAQIVRLEALVNANAGVRQNPPQIVATNSVGGLPDSKQLTGSNYGDWKFLMRNYLVDAGLWGCVEPKAGAVVDPDLDGRCLAKISLSVKAPCSTELRKCKTAKEAWDKLASIHEDSGIVRLVSLYQDIFHAKFENFNSVNEYIAHFVQAEHSSAQHSSS